MSEPSSARSDTAAPDQPTLQTGTVRLESEGAHLGGELMARDGDIQSTLSVVVSTLDEEGGVAECITRIKTALVALDVKMSLLSVMAQ